MMAKRPTHNEFKKNRKRLKDLDQATESHNAPEEARLADVERLSLILDRLPVLTADVDSHQVYRYVNKGYERWFNIPIDQIVGRRVWEVMGEAAYETVRSHLETVLSGTPVRYEGIFPLRDGSVRRFRAHYDPYVDCHGKVQGFSAIVEDITETREAEAALLAEKMRLQEYMDIAEVIIVVLNPDQTVAFINRKGLQILRRPEREVLGQKWFEEFVPERFREDVVSEFNRVLNGGLDRPGSYENPILTRDGEEKTILWRNISLRDKNGRITGTLSSGQDVTERKRDEEMLRWELRVNWALSELYVPLTSKRSQIQDVTAVILAIAKSLTGSPHGYVSIIEPGTGDNVSLTLTEMLKGQCHVSGEARRVRFPRGEDSRYTGLWGHSLNTRRPFFTNEPVAHESSTGLPQGHIPITRFLSVPVLLDQELIGQISLANGEEDYTERDLQGVSRIGRYFALAVQRMRADEALKKAYDELELRVRERTAELYRTQENLEREIQERKGIEKALREGNELLDRIFSNTHLAIAYLDKDFNFIRVNRAYAAYDEQDPDYFKGKNHFQLFPNEENEKIFRQVRDTGVPYTVAAMPFSYADHPERGASFWDWSLIPVTDERRQVEGFVLGLVNVTERILSETMVRESEKKYSTLVENSLIGIYIAHEGKILFTNRQYAAMHGYAPEEMIGMESWRLIHPEDREFFRKLVEDRRLGRDVPLEYELRGITKDGRTISTLRKVSSGDFLGVKASLVNVMDITRLKETEHLLRIQDKMASLGRIAAGIAHELRNPLSGINIHLSNLDRLLEGIDIPDASVAEQMKIVVENLNRASAKIEAVVQRVMDFSRPSTQRLAPANINLIMKRSLELCAVTLRKAGIAVELDLAAALPPCPVNENMIEEVFVNLISNAVHAMETMDGQGRLFVSTFRSGEAVYVRVEDSGPGVPAADEERIFEPFYTDRRDGLGIGLSICFRIVKDHHGLLTVRKSRWGGALFEMMLPLKESGVL